MDKKELIKRAHVKKDMLESLKKLAESVYSLNYLFNDRDTPNDIIKMLPIGSMDILEGILDKEPQLQKIVKVTEREFDMDTISNSTNAVTLLRKMAEDQIKVVMGMDLDEMLDSEGGYSPLRMVYERNGNYLYPMNMKRDDKDYRKRMDLYNEYSNKADEIFRETLEDYYDVKELPQQTKNKLFSQAWEKGHSSGYNEVRYYYDELVDLVKTMV